MLIKGINKRKVMTKRIMINLLFFIMK
jgi:hypothetical protein